MKIASIIIALLLSLKGSAQTQTFDLVTFTPPAGWESEPAGSSVVKFTSVKGNTYCIISIYKSEPGSGNVEDDFKAEWDNLAKHYKPETEPQTEKGEQKNGWATISGGSAFTFDGAKSMVLLSTFSGFGKRTSVLVLTNSEDYLPVVTTFFAGLTLTATTENKTATAPAANAPSVIGTWQKKGGSAGIVYGDAVSYGTAGYGKDQYTFNSNNTYSFIAKTYSASNKEILLVRENGRYELTGSSLTLSPQKSVIESWSKKNGTDKFDKLLSTRTRMLEKTRYQFTLHYFSGIKTWNLVLQHEKPTQRDGPHSTNTTFANAWYYSPISSTHPLVELPGK